MPATIEVAELTGLKASKTERIITNRVRLFTSDLATDQSTPQITYPVPIPSAGFKYSYWKHVCLKISSTFTKVDNIRHYCDGTIGWNFGTAGELRRGNRDSGDDGVGVDSANGHTDDYDQATGTEGDTGDTIESSHAFYSGQSTPVVDIEGDVVGTPMMVDSAGETVAGYSKAVVVQVKVDTNATSGVQTAETLTFKYDVID